MKKVELKKKKRTWSDIVGEEWMAKPTFNWLFTNRETDTPAIGFVLNRLKRLKKNKKDNQPIIYPKPTDVFRAFRDCPPDKVKVVIIGQDPYHDGSATGLAFGNRKGAKISPSLRFIMEASGTKDQTLESWVKQGVLLINTTLTVEKGKPNSHKSVWKPFSINMISSIARTCPDAIFLLWGNEAKHFVNILEHVVPANSMVHALTCSHPASAIYKKNKKWDCDNFIKANIILKENGKEPIKWDTDAI